MRLIILLKSLRIRIHKPRRLVPLRVGIKTITAKNPKNTGIWRLFFCIVIFMKLS